MRKINLDGFIPWDEETWERWQRKCNHAKQQCVNQHANGNRPRFDKNIYGDAEIKTHFYFSEDGPFHGKCAYCESKMQTKTLDHFRPKGGVKDIHNQRVYIEQNGVTKEHPGYYWLAYEWTNLLPSCGGCNGFQDNIGKGERFPVKGKYATNQNETDQEEPLLLNPILDNPEDHFTVDPITGLLSSETEQGNACIEVFGLNERDDLRLSHMDTLTIVKNLFIDFLVKNDEKVFLQQIKAYQEGTVPYSMVALAKMENLLDIMSKAKMQKPSKRGG